MLYDTTSIALSLIVRKININLVLYTEGLFLFTVLHWMYNRLANNSRVLVCPSNFNCCSTGIHDI